MPPSLLNSYQATSFHVKGSEDSWSRFSTPDSMEDIELEPNVVANLLKQINTQAPQSLESPEPLDDEVSTPNHPSERRDSELGQSASLPRQRHRPNVSTMEERLMMMPEKRPLPWRDGVEPGSENETGGESRRKQIRFGCLLATRGDIQEVPCQSCANGRGKFRVCVALEGYFKGACASCQLSGRPNRCSIKKGDSDVEALTPRGDEPPVSSQLYEGPQAKKRRTSQILPNVRPQWEQDVSDSRGRHNMNEVVQRPWSTVNSPPRTYLPPPQILNEISGPSNGPPRHYEQRGAAGWATVNQPPSAPASQFFESRPASDGGNTRNIEQRTREDTVLNEENSTSIIDSLPRSKQRQVYGLVSGIQGGIEHLQRELDSLKKALGIDDED